MSGFVGLDHPLGERINVRGGGGKSTLSRRLASKRGLRYIELDALQWLPEWQPREREDFRRHVSAALDAAGDRWVVDGNYTGDLEDLVLRQADTVVWLDLPWRVMFWRILTRSVARAIDRRPICGDNVQTWSELASRRSLWWYYIANRQRIIRRGERFLPLVSPGVPVVRIQSTAELEGFYRIHGLG